MIKLNQRVFFKIKPFLLMLIFSLVFNSCKKSVDQEVKLPLVSNKAIVDKFLQLPENASTFTKDIVADLKKRELVKPFIAEAAKRNGFPLWDKIIAGSTNGTLQNNPSSKNTIKSNSTESANFNRTRSGIAYIPLVDTNTNEVKSYIFCIKGSDSNFIYNTYNKAEILAQQNIDVFKKAQDNVLLSVHAYFEKQINGKKVANTISKEKGYNYSDINISFQTNPNNNNKQNTTKSVSSLVILAPPCLEYLGGIMITYNDDNGGAVSVIYDFYRPCIETHTLDEVTVYTSINGNQPASGGYPILPFTSILPRGQGPLGNWSDPNTQSDGSNLGGGYIQDPTLNFWGNVDMNPEFSRAKNLARDIDFPYNVEVVSYLLNDVPFMDQIEFALGQNAYNEISTRAASLVVKGVVDNKISKGFAMELFSELITYDELDEFTDAAASAAIEAYNIGDFSSNQAIETILRLSLPHHLTPYAPVLVEYYKLQYKIESLNDPLLTQSFFGRCKVVGRSIKETIHISLDIIGLIPVIGEPADLINGSLYLISGDMLNASLSYLGAVPFAGIFSTGLRLVKKTVTLTNGSKTGLKWLLLSNNTIHFGSSSQLRTVIGLTDINKQAHHVLSWNLFDNPVIQKAAHSGFHMNDLANGIPVAVWRNQPNHSLYDNRIRAGLNAIKEKFGNNFDSVDPKTIANELEKFQIFLKNQIETNSNLHLNDIIFTYHP